MPISQFELLLIVCRFLTIKYCPSMHDRENRFFYSHCTILFSESIVGHSTHPSFALGLSFWLLGFNWAAGRSYSLKGAGLQFSKCLVSISPLGGSIILCFYDQAVSSHRLQKSNDFNCQYKNLIFCNCNVILQRKMGKKKKKYKIKVKLLMRNHMW